MHHVGCHIDPNDVTGRAYRLGGQEAIKSAATAQIQNGLSLFQRGDGLRITTAQPHIGARRNLAQFRFGVAELY